MPRPAAAADAPLAGEPLLLVGVGAVDAALLGWLAAALRLCLGADAEVAVGWTARDAWRLPGRAQLDADAVLDDLARWTDGAYAALAVVAADLGTDDRPWVFGTAGQGAGCAVVGLARLDAPPDSETFRRRLLAEAVHELGHAAGLGHCARPPCVMSPSTSPDGIDLKNADFCAECVGRLRREAARRP